MEPFFERRGPEVNEQADRKIHQAEIGQDLLTVDWGKFFHGFEFHDYAAFHEQVSAETFLENHAVVFKPNDLLPFDMESPFLQRTSQHLHQKPTAMNATPAALSGQSMRRVPGFLRATTSSAGPPTAPAEIRCRKGRHR